MGVQDPLRSAGEQFLWSIGDPATDYDLVDVVLSAHHCYLPPLESHLGGMSARSDTLMRRNRCYALLPETGSYFQCRRDCGHDATHKRA